MRNNKDLEAKIAQVENKCAKAEEEKRNLAVTIEDLRTQLRE